MVRLVRMLGQLWHWASDTNPTVQQPYTAVQWTTLFGRQSGELELQLVKMLRLVLDDDHVSVCRFYFLRCCPNGNFSHGKFRSLVSSGKLAATDSRYPALINYWPSV